MIKDFSLHIGEIINIALPATISTLSVLIAILISTKILGDVNTLNLYILALFIPLNYFLISVYDSIRASSLVLSSHLNINKDQKEIVNNILSLFLVAFGVFVFSILAFILFGEEIAKILNVNMKYDTTFYYFSLTMICVGLIICFNYILTSTMYALKMPKLGMLIIVSASVSTCILTYIISSEYSLGLLGYIISIIISYIITFMIAIGFFKSYGITLRHYAKFEFRKILANFKKIKMVSLPVWFSCLVIFSSIFVISAILSHFDKNVLSGYGIACRIQGIVVLPAISIGSALAILINKQNSVGNFNGAKNILKTGIVISLFVYMAIAVIIYSLRKELSLLVTKDMLVTTNSVLYLKYVSLSYLGMGPILVYLTMLEQIGLGLKSLIINTVYFVLSVGVGGYIALEAGNYIYLYKCIMIVNFISIGYLLLVYASPVLRREESYLYNKRSI